MTLISGLKYRWEHGKIGSQKIEAVQTQLFQVITDRSESTDEILHRPSRSVYDSSELIKTPSPNKFID